MTEEEAQIIADKIYTRIDADIKRFWIEPEMHYNDHKDLRDLLADYRMARGIFWKAFIGFAVVGSFVLALIGFGSAHLHLK